MRAAQAGESDDPRTAAALAFVAELVENRAQVGDADVAALRAAGFDDEEVVELVAHDGSTSSPNYVNGFRALVSSFRRSAHARGS
jgi:alkylhydroperoxidase family enzyme